MNKRTLLATQVASAAVMTAPYAAAQIPAGYPATYVKTIEAAKKEATGKK